MPPKMTGEPNKNEAVDSLESKRDSFIAQNQGKLLEMSLQEIIDLDNITRRENGAPLVTSPSITLQEGEYSSNNGVTIICLKRGGGTENYALAMRVDNASLQQNGFKQVSHYVPFSNGVNKERVPLVARFMSKETELLQAEQKKDDAKYALEQS